MSNLEAFLKKAKTNELSNVIINNNISTFIWSILLVYLLYLVHSTRHFKCLTTLKIETIGITQLNVFEECTKGENKIIVKSLYSLIISFVSYRYKTWNTTTSQQHDSEDVAYFFPFVAVNAGSYVSLPGSTVVLRQISTLDPSRKITFNNVRALKC